MAATSSSSPPVSSHVSRPSVFGGGLPSKARYDAFARGSRGDGRSQTVGEACKGVDRNSIVRSSGRKIESCTAVKSQALPSLAPPPLFPLTLGDLSGCSLSAETRCPRLHTGGGVYGPVLVMQQTWSDPSLQSPSGSLRVGRRGRIGTPLGVK